MPVYYLDTSAIVKRYLEEQGTEVMDRLLDDTGPHNSFYTSWLSILDSLPQYCALPMAVG